MVPVSSGLSQVNDVNLGWTGLSPQTALDPCANFRAGAKVLFAKYNGNPPDAVKAAYAQRVISAIPAPEPAALPAPTPTCSADHRRPDGIFSRQVKQRSNEI